MRIIDAHLHVDRMKGKDVETLSMAGVEAGVLPTPHLLPWMVSSETLLKSRGTVHKSNLFPGHSANKTDERNELEFKNHLYHEGRRC